MEIAVHNSYLFLISIHIPVKISMNSKKQNI